MTHKPIDLKVLASLNAGHYNGLKKVIAAYSDIVYAIGKERISNGMDVEELVADTFHKLWQLKVKEFRDEISLLCWLRVTMNNACTDHWRRKQNKPFFTSLEAVDENYPVVEDYESISEELISIINDGIEQLPNKRKNLILLLREGLSDEEVASKLGIEKSTVRNHRANAIKSIKRYIGLKREII